VGGAPVDGVLCICDPVSWALQLSFVEQASCTSAVGFRIETCCSNDFGKEDVRKPHKPAYASRRVNQCDIYGHASRLLTRKSTHVRAEQL